MDRPRIIRWLRISASAACLIACVAFSVLWVRSYQRLQKVAPHTLSMEGGMTIYANDHFVELYSGYAIPIPETNWLGFGMLTGSVASVTLPDWLLVLLTGLLAAALGVRRPFQFSLRSLLVVTTLVVAGLGIGLTWLKYMEPLRIKGGTPRQIEDPKPDVRRGTPLALTAKRVRRINVLSDLT